MPAETVADFRDFRQFLTEKTGANGVELSPEEALDEWPRLHPQPEAVDGPAVLISKSKSRTPKAGAGR